MATRLLSAVWPHSTGAATVAKRAAAAEEDGTWATRCRPRTRGRGVPRGAAHERNREQPSSRAS